MEQASLHPFPGGRHGVCPLQQAEDGPAPWQSGAGHLHQGLQGERAELPDPGDCPRVPRDPPAQPREERLGQEPQVGGGGVGVGLGGSCWEVGFNVKISQVNGIFIWVHSQPTEIILKINRAQ